MQGHFAGNLIGVAFTGHQVLQELANGCFDSELATINHVSGQVAQKRVFLLTLSVTADETLGVEVVCLYNQQVVENLDGIGLQDVDLSQ